MKLYSGPLSMFGAKVEIAAREKGLDFELILVPFDQKEGYSPKHPEVLRINPKRQVPVWVDGDLELFDSTQIFEYLEDLRPDPPLWPTAARGRARARRLEHESDEVYFPHVIRLMGLQEAPQDPAAVTAIEAARDYYRSMESALGDHAYLAERYSFADIAFYMAQLFGERMGAPMDTGTSRLLAWRERMTARPAVRAVIARMINTLVAQGRPVPGHWRSLIVAA